MSIRNKINYKTYKGTTVFRILYSDRFDDTTAAYQVNVNLQKIMQEQADTTNNTAVTYSYPSDFAKK